MSRRGQPAPALSEADAAAARPSSVSDGIDEISEASDEDDAEYVPSLEDSEDMART